MFAEQSGFDWHEAPTASGTQLPIAAKLRGRLAGLARRGVYLGTSSWKYPGWLGQVYQPARYQARGKFSQKKFEQECLTEYAAVFPTVCGDFAFYQFPASQLWERTFAQVSGGFRFSLKVPEDVTVQRFPDLPRYGRRAGTENPDFMNAELVRDRLLARLERYRDKLGVLIFEFGTVHEGPMREPPQFVARLDEMLAELPTDRYRFAVEVRNPSFLYSGDDYLACLRKHHVAHCLNGWTRMPSVAEQMGVPGVFTADHVVARFLLRPGQTYQQAVEQFSPYEHIRDPYPPGREALHELIERCLAEQRLLFAFVNNRFEGNAIETIDLATEARSALP
ncbi:MAG: DUF72 domain-containing protein [Planctomycetota bacterium]